jgi:two-component system chemotaxis sensor kinase CheA
MTQWDELKQIFLEEALELLDHLEGTLLEIEKVGFNEDLINKAFRLAHNFKGSSKTAGFSELGTFSHGFEDILAGIKNKTKTLTPELVSGLLQGCDFLKKEVEICTQDQTHKSVIEDELARLNRCDSLEVNETIEHQTKKDNPGFVIFEENIKPKSLQTPTAKEIRNIPKESRNTGDDLLKIPTKRLDLLLNVLGEIVVNQSILDECRLHQNLGSHRAEDAVSYMSKLISDIQNLSLSLRLVPVNPLFQKLRRTVRDTAESLGKSIEFIEEGAHGEIDKTILERVTDPLNHMIRNACDHGVEDQTARGASGKSKTAKIILQVLSLEDHIKIIIQDDGRGLDKDKILAKARSNGIMHNASQTDEEIFSLIFAPGFSTKEEVTDVSGRGVGMEVVQKAVEELKGKIHIASEKDKGTTFTITLPLSLSIVQGMIIETANQSFVVPVSQMIETIELSKYQIETVTGTGQSLNLRGEILPVFHLSDVLFRRKNQKKVPQKKRPAIITVFRGKKITFEVDRILSQQKIVLKKLGKEFSGIPGVFAGAVLSNGEPSLVLNLDELCQGAF